MNFIKKFFTKKNSLPILNFQKDVILNPSLWGDEVEQVIGKLDRIEKIKLFQIGELFQESIDWHSKFLLETEYTVKKSKKISDYEAKSLFEVTVLYWALTLKSFSKNKIKDEVGHSLWLMIKFTFIQSQEIKKSFEAMLENRTNHYMNLTNQLFNPRENEVSVYQNLFDTIIETPFNINTEEDELMLSFLTNFGNIEKMPISLAFNKHLAKGISSFTQSLETIYP